MRSEHFMNGLERGKKMLGPMHHNLDREAMKEYLDGYRVGQAEHLKRAGALRGRPPFLK